MRTDKSGAAEGNGFAALTERGDMKQGRPLKILAGDV
jgi:hypothetical protein